MSIQKSIPTQYGVDATEWRILSAVPITADSALLEVTLNGFANASVADAGMQPLTQSRVQIPSGTYDNNTAVETAVLAQQTELSDGTHF